MITKAMAMDLRPGEELHGGTCLLWQGPRGANHFRIEKWRVNGRTKTWKTQPERFSVPIKYGFRGPYNYLTEANAADLHRAVDCPVDLANIQRAAKVITAWCGKERP